MNKNVMYTFAIFIALLIPVSSMAQDVTPTPTLVAFDFRCLGGVDAANSFLVNGDFEFRGTIGLAPNGWGSDVASGLTGELTQQFLNGVRQQFVILRNGASISQKPQPNLESAQNSSNFYRLRFCAVVEGGVLTVEFAGETIMIDGTTRIVNIQQESENIRADLSEAGNTPPVTFTFNGDGTALVDNVELLSSPQIGGESTPAPSPSPEITPSPVPSPGPSHTPIPTLEAGKPTLTPTPSLSANSVQVVADPPMLVLSPNDFIAGSDPKKQILLDVRVIGTNGEVIKVTDIDEDATIQFTVDTRGEAVNAGRLLERTENGNETTLQSQRRPMNEVEQVIFVPGKAFDGTIRVIVDIEFDSDVDGSQERHEIRGIVPIVFRTNRSASMTGAVGTFNLRDAQSAGRKAGDRGFRPDQKTNLFFREVFK
jgi:hypothetical protein